MPLWKITNKNPSKVKETKIKQEKLREEHLEDRIVAGAKAKNRKVQQRRAALQSRSRCRLQKPVFS
jgi:hypothetical protein